MAELFNIEEDLDVKIKFLDDLKKERTENVDALVAKVTKVKVQNEKLKKLKEKYVAEAKKKLVDDPTHPDLNVIL